MSSKRTMFASALIASFGLGSLSFGLGAFGSLVVTPLMGQPQNVCLQRKDITSWQAIDERTIVFRAGYGPSYTIRFVDACPSGASDPAVVFRSMKTTGCIAIGDHIDVTAGGSKPPYTCVIESVKRQGAE